MNKRVYLPIFVVLLALGLGVTLFGVQVDAADEGQIFFTSDIIAGWTNTNSFSVTAYAEDVGVTIVESAWGVTTRVGECSTDQPMGGDEEPPISVSGMFALPDGYVEACAVASNGFGGWDWSAVAYIDTVSPTASDNFSVKNNIWQKENQTITITTTDYQAGISISNIYGLDYATSSANNCAPTDFNLLGDFLIGELSAGAEESVSEGESTTNGAITFSQEGTTYFCYKPRDHANNAGEITTRIVKIDKTNPTVSDNYSSKDATTQAIAQNISISASDTLSGLSKIIYCTDTTNTCSIDANNGASTTEATLALTFDTEGTTYLRYRALDNAGNLSSVVARTITIDYPNSTRSGSVQRRILPPSPLINPNQINPTVVQTLIQILDLLKQIQDLLRMGVWGR